MAKADYVEIQTGRGEAFFPALHKEDTYQGKPNGKFATGIILTGPALEAAKAAIQQFIDDSFPAKRAKSVVQPWKTTKDGKPFLKFSTFARDKEGREKTVPLFDAKGNPVKRAVAVGNGSIIRVTGSMGAGKSKEGDKDTVRLFLSTVQIIKLKEFIPGAGASGYEAVADDEEDAWVADEFDGEARADQGAPDGSADF